MAKSDRKKVRTPKVDAPVDVPKVGPVKYVGQVRQEARKVVWPTWRETLTTTVLVMIMVVLMGIFFFFVDWALASIVRLVLGLGGA